jgi:hypothetical protein
MAELYIFSVVHHSHSASAQLLDDAEMRYGLTDQWIGSGHDEHILGCPLEPSQRRHCCRTSLRALPDLTQVLINALIVHVKF